jgi:hypothetical protein
MSVSVSRVRVKDEIDGTRIQSICVRGICVRGIGDRRTRPRSTAAASLSTRPRDQLSCA